MKLKRIDVSRVPGIDTPFALAELSPGLNIIVGPNGIGKSQLCRAVQASLWQGGDEIEGYFKTSILLEHENVEWVVEKDGDHSTWRKNNVEAASLIDVGNRLSDCFFLSLRDLLEQSDSTGSDLARKIQLQMSGGYDLRAALGAHAKARARSFGRSDRRQVDTAEKAIRAAVGAQTSTAHREDGLAELRLELKRVRSEGLRLSSHQAALQFKELQRKRQEMEDILSRFSQVVGKLEGNEDKRVSEIEDKIRQGEIESSIAQQKIADAHEKAAETKLADAIEAGKIEYWKACVNTLNGQQVQLEQAGENFARSLGATRAAKKAAGIKKSTAIESIAGLGDAEILFAFLRDSQEVSAAFQVALRTVEDLRLGEIEEADSESLQRQRQAILTLRQWLRVPGPLNESSDLTLAPSKTLVLAMGALFLVTGFGLGVSVHGALWSIAGLGAGIIAAVLVIRPRGNPTILKEKRQAVAKNFPVAIEAPQGWDQDHVKFRLESLEAELARAELLRERADLHKREIKRETKRLEDVKIQLLDLKKRGQEIANKLGIEEFSCDANLVNWIRALDCLREALREEEAQKEKVEKLERQFMQNLTNLGDELEEVQEPRPRNAEEANARVNRADQRNQDLKDAQKDAKHAGLTLAKLTTDIEELKERRKEIFELAELELGDVASLSNLVDDVERRKRAKEELAILDGLLAGQRKILKESGEEDLTDLTTEELLTKCHSLEPLPAAGDNIQRQISDIESEVKRAREGHSIETALAERDGKLLILKDKRDEALTAHCGAFLLNRVRAKHEKDQLPEVFARAQEHFAAFTQAAYRLEMTYEKEARFVAVESSTGRVLTPSQLSDGTRAQLILSARFAFAEHTEKGLTIPLFLDEALDHSDPQRFQAIAQCLAKMTSRGRQIFYLTNDPSDVKRLSRVFDEELGGSVKTHDLAQIRLGKSSVRSEADLDVSPLKTIPPPEGKDAEAYALQLAIPALSPCTHAENQHLWYVLWDDLPCLHRLLSAGISTVGQWKTLSATRSAVAKELRASSRIAAQLDDRSGLLVVFCREWMVGRGRPIDRGVIEASGAISERYIEAVVDRLSRVEGRGTDLLDILEGRATGRPKGLRSNKVDDLRVFLVEHGYIDEAAILSEEEIFSRVVATLFANKLPGEVVRLCVHRWWELAAK